MSIRKFRRNWWRSLSAKTRRIIRTRIANHFEIKSRDVNFSLIVKFMKNEVA